MKSLWDEIQLFACIGMCHLFATVVVNIYAALWFVGKYEHAQMMMEVGKRVALPVALVTLEYLGKAFLYPLVPIIYAWGPTSKFPVELTVILNSSFVSLIILFAYNKVSLFIWKKKVPWRNASR
jgi:hypothetical protein